MAYDADVIVIGAGLAGLVATAELADAGRSVILLDQEPEQALGGQAHWSFGGLFLVDSPEQRRMRIKDSRELALQDWYGTAGFDREDEDRWPRKWAEAYVDFAAGEKRSWLHQQGLRIFPVVGWAERGGYDATGHGNSVPRFHITWGTGPGVVAPFERRVREGVAKGLVQLRFRHRVTGLSRTAGALDTVTGEVLEPSAAERGTASSREVAGAFELKAQAVIVTSGGIGGNHDLVRAQWPERLGTPPEKMLSGVPAHVDGLMLGIAERAGAHHINRDRMWHYTEGIENWNPIWPGTASGSSRPLVPLAGRARQAAAGPALPRVRHARHPRTHHGLGPRLHLVRTQPAHHRQGVRPLRLRTEPGPHRQVGPRRDRPGPRGRTRSGQGVHGPRADFVVEKDLGALVRA